MLWHKKVVLASWEVC